MDYCLPMLIKDKMIHFIILHWLCSWNNSFLLFIKC